MPKPTRAATPRLLAAAALALALVGAACSGTLKPALSKDVPAPIFTRVEISTFTAAQVNALRQGVARMQQRPATDPTSWHYQANIHGVPEAGANCPANTIPLQESWATCQHGSFFFLAWHRMYLYYFERILRAAAQQALGDPAYEFALPYWDYSAGSPQLPPPFTTLADAGNSLYVSERRASCNVAVPGQSCVTATQGSPAQALATVPVCNCPSGEASCDGCLPGLLPDETFHGQFTPTPVHFLGAFGELESQPHNTVHNRVGGPTGWMADPDCAARDPIFWLHHANIDRLWQVWLNDNAGRVNPLGSTAWTTQPFVFFDADGSRVEKTACEILDMVTQLDYRYEGLPVENVVLCSGAAAPTAGAEPAPVTLAASAERTVTLGRSPVTVVVPMPPGLRERLAGLADGDRPDRVRLVVEGLERLGKGVVVEVYLDLPEGTPPDPRGPHFVGHIALFGHRHQGHEAVSTRSFDLTDEIRDLRGRDAWRGDARLTFVPADGDQGPAEALRLRRVSLVTRER